MSATRSSEQGEVFTEWLEDFGQLLDGLALDLLLEGWYDSECMKQDYHYHSWLVEDVVEVMDSYIIVWRGELAD